MSTEQIPPPRLKVGDRVYYRPCGQTPALPARCVEYLGYHHGHQWCIRVVDGRLGKPIPEAFLDFGGRPKMHVVKREEVGR